MSRPILAERRAGSTPSVVLSQQPGKPRLDDRRVLTVSFLSIAKDCVGVTRQAHTARTKTFYNRSKRWGERGVFVRMVKGLATAGAEPKAVMIDATYLKAHRTASSPASRSEIPQ